MPVECEHPECDRCFDTELGMKVHHYQVHGESIARETTTCPICGETFEHKQSVDRSFCSIDCRTDYQGELWEGEGSPRYNRVAVTCHTCGSEFRKKPVEVEKTDLDFCCRECWREWCKTRTGADNPNWNGGASPISYGGNWVEQSTKAKERAGWQCEVCGADPPLDAHHLIKAERFDDPDRRNALSNLMAVCRTCHRRWEGIPLRPQ